jgi:peptidoglycan/xylan/chitin deacetylase (PgdA/CDA1 family)
VEEFFELFKTPWEHYRNAMEYEVVLTSDPASPVPLAKLVIAFGAKETFLDNRSGVRIRSVEEGGDIEWEGATVPVYGRLMTFLGTSEPFLTGNGGKAVGFAIDHMGRKFLRVGYDLFGEVEYLLRHGQPVGKAHIPTMEIHISMLRKWIAEGGVPLLEIPPSPHGYDFITCLTHDIDFMGIRDHIFDHTMFGFIYRSLVPIYLSGLDRKTFCTRYLKNLRALLSLPMVHMGVLPDFWYSLDKYPAMEKEMKSTFFFLPFKGRPGDPHRGKPGKFRAARYDVDRYREPIRSLTRTGHEVGLHGIDTWKHPRKGFEELEIIRGITGKDRIGVRMHWLYFSEETPKRLEEAGVYYDSTLGYNDAAGFRSGTTQVFRLPGTSTVFELPLHVQDTAMLYPGRMNLSEKQARDLCGKLIRDVKSHGGVFTINWHDRSLAPERNWDTLYLGLLDTLRAEKPWFATGGEAVSWFEKRRAARFERAGAPGSFPEVRLREPVEGDGPPLALRIHPPAVPGKEDEESRVPYVDYPLTRGVEHMAGQ